MHSGLLFSSDMQKWKSKCKLCHNLKALESTWLKQKPRTHVGIKCCSNSCYEISICIGMFLIKTRYQWLLDIKRHAMCPGKETEENKCMEGKVCSRICKDQLTDWLLLMEAAKTSTSNHIHIQDTEAWPEQWNCLGTLKIIWYLVPTKRFWVFSLRWEYVSGSYNGAQWTMPVPNLRCLPEFSLGSFLFIPAHKFIAYTQHS